MNKCANATRLFACLTALVAASVPVSAGDPPSPAGGPTETREKQEPRSSPQPNSPDGYVSEAPLPEGFPPPGKVGEPVEKEYPLIRSFSAPGRGAFMQCFNYLQKQGHEMTAPVIMEGTGKDSPAPEDPEADFMRFDRMHFLLEKPSLDSPKVEGQVTVCDLPKLLVLSIAYQGRLDGDVFKSNEANLRAHLAERADLEAAGKLRVLGYNGPGTPRARQYWEFQIPVKRVPKS